MNRIFLILALLVAIILGATWYVHRVRTQALNSGAVFVREQSGGGAVPQPAQTTPADKPTASPQTVPAKGADQSGVQPPALPGNTASGNVLAGNALPGKPTAASDSINRNPPNGMLFEGTGKYQLYRQGDITWRLNTDTGWACVLFATDAQWRKTRVYQDGCRASSQAAAVRGY